MEAIIWTSKVTNSLKQNFRNLFFFFFKLRIWILYSKTLILNLFRSAGCILTFHKSQTGWLLDKLEIIESLFSEKKGQILSFVSAYGVIHNRYLEYKGRRIKRDFLDINLILNFFLKNWLKTSSSSCPDLLLEIPAGNRVIIRRPATSRGM